jgi:hypothetical protein
MEKQAVNAEKIPRDCLSQLELKTPDGADWGTLENWNVFFFVP